MLLLCSCASRLPWNNAAPADEVNLAFNLHNNLLFLPSVTINGRAGHFFFGSATPRTVIDARFAPQLSGADSKYTANFGNRVSIPFTPAVLDLGGTGDGLLGNDLFAGRAVTIDYRAGLVTYEKSGIHTESMKLFGFTGDPAIDVDVDGRRVSAIVDTTSPDTLTLPGANASRRRAHVTVAGAAFPDVDIRTANTDRARIGNRLLSKFLVAIDYRNHVVGLWRDPRIP